MKNFISIFLFFFSISINAQHIFEVDLNNRENDQFHVTLYPKKLTSENKVYNFAATAPGTYQLMNIGRYVRAFAAFDKMGNNIETNNISINKWEITSPEKIHKITYSIAETWDTPVDENSIYHMAGSSFEDDHALINGQCVFGYFDGMQNYPINIMLDYPNDWELGTALIKNSEGFYEAKNFDHVVDSPILLGRLSKSSLDVSGTEINVFTYSKTDLINSEDLLTSIKDILFAAEKFTSGLPVDNYTFLFHFEDFGAGAWEHSYSSIYVFTEAPLTDNYKNTLRSTVAHEFFHIVTPLNIHSEVVNNFNFSDPKLSQHIWLYEGVTEWASDALQLRDNIITINDYLNATSLKLRETDNFNKDITLQHLSLNSFELQDQFYIFYCRGAVTAALLDIKILDLSNGEKGLREVINQLANDYGADKSFSEENFFDEFTERTYPEIRQFINDYIIDSKPLPIKEYFNKIGINYHEFQGYDSTRIEFSFGLNVKDSKLHITTIEDKNLPLKIGDIVYKINDEIITMENMQTQFGSIFRKKPGDILKLILIRDGVEFKYDYKLGARKIKHNFAVNENATDLQLELRERWSKNLD